MSTTITCPSTTFRAMGCQIDLWLEADESSAAVAFEAVEKLFAENERILSRFSTTSELTQLNGRTGEWVPVSDLLWNVLEEALIWAAETNGLFDPTCLNALEAAGYVVSFEAMATAQFNGRHQAHHLLNGQWSSIQLDPAHQAVYLPYGLRIDLGGIAKGYTAQQAVDLMSPWGACLVNAGGDLVAGAAPSSLPGWPVGVAKPSEAGDPADNALSLWLENAALATSGVDYRRWTSNGRAAHHLIDPRTGLPAITDLVTATVWAAQATEAEVRATTSLIMGRHTSLDNLENQSHLAAVLFDTDGEMYQTSNLGNLVI
ncbi:MAG: FAD:protein FMN transferase [Ardenticatenaceae bacterium]|nr:FAD:protein FMN transferase [Ardenticatenaceae bacterium]MCB8988191.1 FAD:protein FMN transferase [Ardenticatenaceae bacterium]